MHKLSHRYPHSKFVRVDARKDKSHAIITCTKDGMADVVKRYQDLGYKIENVKEV